MPKATLPVADQTPAVPDLPEGWRAEVTAGGMVRLAEARSSRTVRGVGVLCLGIVWNVGFWIQVQHVRWALTADAPGLRLLALVAQALVGVVLVAWAGWLLCGHEEWRLGRGRLIVQRRLCGWRWERRFVEGWFRLIIDVEGNSHLLVQPPGGAPTVLCHGTATDSTRIARFGAFLAAQSHWALREEGSLARGVRTEGQRRIGNGWRTKGTRGIAGHGNRDRTEGPTETDNGGGSGP